MNRVVPEPERKTAGRDHFNGWNVLRHTSLLILIVCRHHRITRSGQTSGLFKMTVTARLTRSPNALLITQLQSGFGDDFTDDTDTVLLEPGLQPIQPLRWHGKAKFIVITAAQGAAHGIGDIQFRPQRRRQRQLTAVNPGAYP